MHTLKNKLRHLCGDAPAARRRGAGHADDLYGSARAHSRTLVVRSLREFPPVLPPRSRSSQLKTTYNLQSVIDHISAQRDRRHADRRDAAFRPQIALACLARALPSGRRSYLVIGPDGSQRRSSSRSIQPASFSQAHEQTAGAKSFCLLAWRVIPFLRS